MGDSQIRLFVVSKMLKDLLERHSRMLLGGNPEGLFEDFLDPRLRGGDAEALLPGWIRTRTTCS